MSTPTSTHYASYLVRLWRKASGEGSLKKPCWHSEVEHIQSGGRWAFDTAEDLLAFLGQQMEPNEQQVPRVMPQNPSRR